MPNEGLTHILRFVFKTFLLLQKYVLVYGSEMVFVCLFFYKILGFSFIRKEHYNSSEWITILWVAVEDVNSDHDNDFLASI